MLAFLHSAFSVNPGGIIPCGGHQLIDAYLYFSPSSVV